MNEQLNPQLIVGAFTIDEIEEITAHELPHPDQLVDHLTKELEVLASTTLPRIADKIAKGWYLLSGIINLRKNTVHIRLADSQVLSANYSPWGRALTGGNGANRFHGLGLGFPQDSSLYAENTVAVRPVTGFDGTGYPDYFNLLAQITTRPIIEEEVPDGGYLVFGDNFIIHKGSLNQEQLSLLKALYPSKKLIALPPLEELFAGEYSELKRRQQESYVAEVEAQLQTYELKPNNWWLASLLAESLYQAILNNQIDSITEASVPDGILAKVQCGEDLIPYIMYGSISFKKEVVEAARLHILDQEREFIAQSVRSRLERQQKEEEYKFWSDLLIRERAQGHIDQLVGAPITHQGETIIPIAAPLFNRMVQQGYLAPGTELSQFSFLPVSRELLNIADLINYQRHPVTDEIFFGPLMAGILLAYVNEGIEGMNRYQETVLQQIKEWTAPYQTPESLHPLLTDEMISGDYSEAFTYYKYYSQFLALMGIFPPEVAETLQSSLHSLGLNISVYEREFPLVGHGGVKCRTNWV